MTPEERNALHRLADQWSHNYSHADCRRLLLEWLDAQPLPTPAVPVNELADWLKRGWAHGEFEALLAKHTPKPALPPNPHPQGTYLWAREEHVRGNRVGRARRKFSDSDIFDVLVEPGQRAWGGWDKTNWQHGDFIATDWEVVK